MSKALRSAGGTRYACSGRKTRNIICEADRGPWLIGANWQLENAKSPAATLQENNPDATCMSILNRVCSWYLVVLAMYVYIRIYVYISKLVTTEFLSVGWRIGTDIEYAGCRCAEKAVKTQQAAAWNIWLKRQQRNGCFWSRQSHRYSRLKNA